MSRRAASIDEILDLYRRWGSQHYDEALSQTSHALQTAACARADDAADELVAAALLHDVGHLLVMDAAGSGEVDPEVDTGHEASGARYLAGRFPAGVTAPIALHVLAKRYRCAVDPAAVDRLSAAPRPASCARAARSLPTRPPGSPATPPPTTRCGCGPGTTPARTWVPSPARSTTSATSSSGWPASHPGESGPARQGLVARHRPERRRAWPPVA